MDEAKEAEFVLFCLVLLYFVDYAVTVVLIFSPLPPSTQHLPLPQAIPCLCSCPWVMLASSLATPFPIQYFISPWLFCNYLFVFLISSPFTHSPTTPSHLFIFSFWHFNYDFSWGAKETVFHEVLSTLGGRQGWDSNPRKFKYDSKARFISSHNTPKSTYHKAVATTNERTFPSTHSHFHDFPSHGY